MTTVVDNSSFTKTFKSSMSDREFARLSEFIQKECGIKMPLSKKTMLESRLQKRLRSLGLSSYTEYIDCLFSPGGSGRELVNMIDVVTTNKTDFFREPKHFEFLYQKALPELISKYDAGISRKLTIWSAGCSTGEEPYTLSMVLSDYAEKCAEGRFNYSILATDISSQVLEKAKSAVYKHDIAEAIPDSFRRKYLLRSKDRSRNLVKISRGIREKVNFRRLNFLDSDFAMRERQDVIFCRNVLIYFDRRTQEKLLTRFCGHLVPGGYMFLGHSETLHGMNVPVEQVAPTTYRKLS